MASTSISKTYSSAGNRQKWTWSAWIKRSSLTSASNGQTLWNCEGSSASDNFIFQIDGGGGTGGPTDSIGLHTYGNDAFRTIPLLRDTSGWYHIVLALDTTQATATNRIKLYVNGVLQLYSQETNFPTQNYEMGINRAAKHCIGSHGTNANYYFDGYMSHIHFCDGYQYAASDFGETDSNGVWKIKTAPSVSYGTNGFFILKDGNSLTDQSPNSNNFSSNGGTLTNDKDNPSNVFATFNNLHNFYEGGTYSNGNNKIVTGGSNKYTWNNSTFGMATGKYYAEFKWVSGGSDMLFGLTDRFTTSATEELGQYATQYGYRTNGTVRNNNGNLGGVTVASWTTGDIIGVAYDATNKKLYFSKNGTWQNSGDPTSGSTGTGAISVSASPQDGLYYFSACAYDDSQGTLEANFGNGRFGTTAVSSAGTNASNNGVFEYDVPTGYTALCTKGLNS